jgi:1,4-dihydroxy-2-naphthoate polyprenyltransferase
MLQIIKDLLILGRLHFLAGGFLLYSLGYLLAAADGYPLGRPVFLFGYLVIFFSQLSVSYSNDYFDVCVDRIGGQTLFSGGSGILCRKPHLMQTAKLISYVCIFSSLAASVLLVAAFDFSPLAFIFAAAGNFLGWYYSAPPLKFAYRGFGEISTALAAGFFMPAFGNFTAAHHFTSSYLMLMLPLLLCGLMFIVLVEIPDMEADLAGGKMNFVARSGRKKAFLAVSLIAVAITIYFVCLFIVLGARYVPIAVMSFLPLISGIICGIRRPSGRYEASRLSTMAVISLMVFLLGCDVLFLTTI